MYWGESLLLGGVVHGIAYSQNSVDVWKGLATPGTEAKEVFRPRGGLTIQAQPAQELSLVGQWFYNWQAVRLPESGSYLSSTDPLNFGGDSIIVGPNQRLWNVQAVRASRYSGSLGDFGVAARWSPKALDGTLGFYYRNATDILPQLMVTPGVQPLPSPQVCQAIGGQPLAPVSPTPCLINGSATNVEDLQKYGKVGTYQTAYGNNIHIYGLSLAKQIAGVSVGAEVSYRQNMPLLSDPVTVLPAPLVPLAPGAIATTAIPAHADTPGALGNTWHGVVNGIAIVPKTAAVRHGEPARRAFVDARLERHAERSGVQGTCRLRRHRQADVDVRRPRDQLHADLVPGAPGRRSDAAGHLGPGLERRPPRRCSAATRMPATGASGSARRSTRNTSSILPTSPTTANTIPTRPAPRRVAVPFAGLADRGWVSLTFKTTF